MGEEGRVPSHDVQSKGGCWLLISRGGRKGPAACLDQVSWRKQQMLEHEKNSLASNKEH